MSSSNNRFGRRTARQNDDLRAEPVFSFKPKKGEDARRDPAPPVDRKRQAAPRVEREDAEEFRVSFGRDNGSGFERHDGDFDPRMSHHDALEPRVPASERPLYHHLFDENEKRHGRVGWVAALGSVAVIAIGAAYAWHNFMARPAPANLFDPPGFATRGNSGYTTPTQPLSPDATAVGSSPAPLGATPPAADPQSTRDVAATPQPKAVPSEAPPPPKKTISEAAANPGSLGPPVDVPNAAPPAPAPTPTKPAVTKAAPIVAPPPPKRDTAKQDAAKQDAPKQDAVKRDAPRKEASITPPKPAPAPARQSAPQDAPPPAAAQPAAAPANIAPPPPRYAPPQTGGQPQATGQPLPLNRNAPVAYPPPPNYPPPSSNAGPGNASPSYAGPPPNAPDTVTVDGVTYVNGQEPRALGTLNGAPAGDAPMPPGVPVPLQSSPSNSPRPYTPIDRDGGAPLPNDVIILPNGQLAVPNGR